MLSLLTSNNSINIAYRWVCENRKHYPPNADIWDLRFHWENLRDNMIAKIKSGKYRFKPLQIVTKSDGTRIALWGASDALVIKALTNTLESTLPVHRSCAHTKGHGGGKASALRAELEIKGADYRYVCRTDIKGCYANISKSILLNQLNDFVSCPILHDLLYQFLNYTVEDGGNFHTPNKGISRGSSLSPLLAAFHLYVIDAHFSTQREVYYTRYMDDFLILTQTR